MTPFNWNYPIKLSYGPVRIKEVGAIASGFGKKTVTSTYAKGGHFDPIIEVGPAGAFGSWVSACNEDNGVVLTRTGAYDPE